MNSGVIDIRLKNIFLTLVIGGSSLMIYSEIKSSEYKEKKGLEKKIENIDSTNLMPLERYNIEHAQIYSDFENFMLNHPNKELYNKNRNAYKIIINSNPHMYFSEKNGKVIEILVDVPREGKIYFDFKGDGLDANKETGEDYFGRVINDKIEEKKISELSLQEQLKNNQEYTELLIKTMHDAGYKKY